MSYFEVPVFRYIGFSSYTSRDKIHGCTDNKPKLKRKGRELVEIVARLNKRFDNMILLWIEVNIYQSVNFTSNIFACNISTKIHC